MLYDLTATAAYPPGQYPPEPIPGPYIADDYVGLGLSAEQITAVAGAGGVAGGAARGAAIGSIVPGVGTAIGAGVGAGTAFLVNLFGGGGGGDTPSGWVENAYSGALVPCATGRAQRTPPDVAGQVPPVFPSWREGYSVGPYDVGEVLAAIQAAPEGSSQQTGTRQGLIHALMYPAGPGTEANMRAPRNNEELARMAVYVAGGRADCGVGWREEPGTANLEAMLRNYREQAAQAAAAPILPWLNSGPGGGGAELPELGELARANPLATVGIMVALALGAGLLARGM